MLEIFSQFIYLTRLCTINKRGSPHVKNSTNILFFVLISLLIFTSCATLFKGSHSHVDFNSSPGNAQVYINGTLRGNTPLNLKLESDKNYQIEIKKEGYATITYHLGKEIGAKWVILDILGGMVPIVIDAVTGSWYELSQDYVNITLSKTK